MSIYLGSVLQTPPHWRLTSRIVGWVELVDQGVVWTKMRLIAWDIDDLRIVKVLVLMKFELHCLPLRSIPLSEEREDAQVLKWSTREVNSRFSQVSSDFRIPCMRF